MKETPNKKITPENLLSVLEGKEEEIFIGGWSRYALAEIALPHYFPDKYNEEESSPTIMVESEMIKEIGCQSWEDIIEKYHKEIGYTQEQLADTQLVNEN